MSKKPTTRKQTNRKSAIKARIPIVSISVDSTPSSEYIDSDLSSSTWDNIDHEIITHLLGPDEPAAGKTIDAAAEAQRQATIKHEIERLARQYGFDLSGEFHRDAVVTSQATERAAEIEDLASPMMQAAATHFTFKYKGSKRRTIKPDGKVVVEIVGARLKATVNVRESLKAMGSAVVRVAKVAISPVKMAMGLTVKIGKWLNVKAAGKSE